MFTPVLQSLVPEYEGERKVERWSATALATDGGPATLQARFLRQIDSDGVEVDSFGGSNPSSILVTGNTVLFYLPGGGDTATTYQIKLSTRF